MGGLMENKWIKILRDQKASYLILGRTHLMTMRIPSQRQVTCFILIQRGPETETDATKESIRHLISRTTLIGMGLWSILGTLGMLVHYQKKHLHGITMIIQEFT